MGAGSYTINTRTDGTVVTATIYNADHQKHVDNHNFEKLDDYSTDVTQMKVTRDPYAGSTEVVATNGAEEITGIRGIIKKITQTSEWYKYAKLLSKTANYTATVNDRIILCDATAGDMTITLPTAVGAPDSKEYTIVKTDSSANTVTIDGDGSETINGSATKVLSNQYETINIISNNANWIQKVSVEKNYTGHKTVNLWGNSATVGTWALNIDTACIGNGGYLNSSLAINDSTTYKEFFAAGTYDFKFLYFQNTNRGILTLKIDGTSKGTLDMYGTTTRNVVGSITDVVISTAGIYDVVLIAATKNASSSAYGMYLQGFSYYQKS